MNSEKVNSKKSVSKKTVSKKYPDPIICSGFTRCGGCYIIISECECPDEIEDKNEDENESLSEEKNRKLESENKELKKELDKKNSFELNLRAVIDDLRTQKDEDKEKIRQQKENANSVRIINNNQTEKLHKIIDEKNEEIRKYGDTIERLEYQLKEDGKYKLLEQRFNFLIKEYEEAKEIIIKRNGELNELKQRIKDGYEYDIHDIRQEQAHERRSHQETVKKLKDRICEIDNSDEGQKMRIGVISNLENQIDDLKKCIGQLKYKYYDINKEKDDINKEKDDINKELDKVKEEYAYIKKDSRHFANLSVTRNDELRRLDREIKLLINMLEEYRGLGGLSGDMMWTLQVKLNTILKPNYKVPEEMKDNHICRINRGYNGWY